VNSTPGPGGGRLLIVSADGHAVMPEEAWSAYLEPAFHEHLARLSEENARFTEVMLPLNDYDLIYAGAVSGSHYDVFDGERHYRDGRWAGAWDLDVRLAEMDREGVAAEFVFSSYYRAVDPFFNVSNTLYPLDAVEAGARAYNRWAHDTFGSAADRLLLVGVVGRSLHVDVVVREAGWLADHGFAGMYMPGFSSHPDQTPLDDEAWEPLWALCAERGLTLVVHGGYGMEPGRSYGVLTDTFQRVKADGGTDADAVTALRSGMFNDSFFTDLRCRRPLWQLMLGGVFDRHPDLRLMMTEVRGDWVPATLAHLDAAFEANRADLPATTRPSDLWLSNCMAGLSFMHRSEVDMRHEIGVSTLSFGRDYPHTEGTWPNTEVYLRTLLAGVPEGEARMIMGENLARFLHLDLAALQPIVDRVGFRPEDVLVDRPDIDPELQAHFDARCGYSKPAEGASRVDQIDSLLLGDLERIGAR
jgi:predicted TIM-barrel fold metal-dependent hydrolase